MTIKKYCPHCGGDTKQDVNGIGMTICQVCKLDCTSDTPRTDNFIATDSFPMAGYDALCEFARDLEREITILKRRVSEYQPYADAAICNLPETTKTPRKDVTDCRGRAARDWLRGLVRLIWPYEYGTIKSGGYTFKARRNVWTGTKQIWWSEWSTVTATDVKFEPNDKLCREAGQKTQ